MSNQHPEVSTPLAALVRRTWGAATRIVSTAALAGDASSRSYLRLRLEGDAPSSIVVMVQPGSGLSLSSDELAVFSEPLREMPFLNVHRYLRTAGIAVPDVHGADGDLVLLEDLGDITLWDAVRGAPETKVLHLYRGAIDEMIAMEIAGTLHPDADCIAFGQRFDSRLFLWELDHFLEYGFTGRTVADTDRAELRRRFEDLSETLAAGPAVLTHRDYHSWNLFVFDGRIRVIDFQDALIAPVPYDLATLLNDRATPTVVTPDRERELIAYFLRRRAERAGDEASFDDFFLRYDRFLLQKSLKIVGRFHYLEQVKGRRGYVAMLPDTFATLRRCLGRQPELHSLARILERSFPELRGGEGT